MTFRSHAAVTTMSTPSHLGMLISTVLLSSCASLGTDRPASPLISSSTAAVTFRNTTAKMTTGDASYLNREKKPSKATWVTCQNSDKKSAASVAVMHGDKAGFEPAKFCSGWIAQAFLAQGFDVVTVNRPGYGSSTGPADFSGPDSIAAVTAALSAAQQQSSLAPVQGLWGFSSGAIAAGFSSKTIKSVKWLLLGGGLYDLDTIEAKSKDRYIQAEIAMIKKSAGDDALPDRSLAYDVSGMPSQIIIYHGQQDTSAPLDQAEAFRDALTSSQYKVTFHALENTTHDIPWRTHRQLLEGLLAGLQSPAAMTP